MLKEFFGEKPDYFLDIEQGKRNFIDALPDQEQVEKFFWERIEESFTNWAENEEKLPEDWANSIHQSLKDELKQNLFHDFSSALKEELKENERAWKSFEFASSLQTVSMLQSLASNTARIKDDTSHIKNDLAELNSILPLVMRNVLNRFDALESTVKEFFISNQNINELLIDFRNDVTGKLSEIGKDVSETKDYAKQTVETTKVIEAGVKKLLGEKTKTKKLTAAQPKLPRKIKKLLEKAKEIRNDSRFNEAGEIYVEALELAEKLDDQYAIALCKLRIASTLNDQHEFPEEALNYINDAEKYFRENHLEKDLASALFESSVSELNIDGFINARLHLKEALDIYIKLNDKFHEAACYFQMGWMEHGQGHLNRSKELYRKAIEIFEDESINEETKIISARIGACYAHIALVAKAEMDVDAAETNLLRAIDYFRQSNLKISLGQSIFFLAELKIKTQQLEIGQKYLREAGMIFEEIKAYRLLAEALDLLSKIEYTFGDKERAVKIFHSAISAIEQTNDVKNKLKYYGKLAELYKIEKRYSEAEDLNRQIMELAEKEKDDEEYYSAVLGIVGIKKAEGKTKERNEIGKKGIEKLKQALVNAQRETKRAHLLGDIASLYTECENYFEAKKYFSLAKDTFITLSDKAGISKCLGALAYIYRLENNFKKEMETYVELKELTEGSQNYYAHAVSIFNLCHNEINNGNFELARKYFSEAEYLNYNYGLNLEEELEHLETILNLSTDAHTKPERSIKELIEDFYSEVNFYPKERIHHLRFWIYFHGNELFANYKYMEGLKFLIVMDDTELFLNMSSGLNSIGELFLQSFNTKFETGRSMLFHYPKERLIPKGISILTTRGDTTKGDIANKKIVLSKKTKKEYEDEKESNHLLRMRHSSNLTHYSMCLVEDSQTQDYEEFSKKAKEMDFEFHDYPGNIILGYPIIFPKQFEDLLLNSSSDEILHRKIFFDISDRGGHEDKFRSDLHLAKQLNLIPIYFKSLPKSDKTVVAETTEIALPVFDEELAIQHTSEVNKIKNLLIKFRENIDSPKSKLQILKIEIAEILEKLSLPTLHFEFYVLELLSFEEKYKIPVMVLIDRN